MNDKSYKEEKENILTQLIDEFFERKRAGEDLSLDDFIKRCPEYADEIKDELEEELFWLSKFNKFKEPTKIISTKKELQQRWENFRKKINPWEIVKGSIYLLKAEISIHIEQLIQQIIIPDILQSSILHRKLATPVMREDGSSSEIEEIEIPISEIDGLLRITLYPSEDKKSIAIKIQPEIREAGYKKRAIPVILRDRIKDKMEERTNIKSGEVVAFTLSIGKSYYICIQLNGKRYEVPLRCPLT